MIVLGINGGYATPPSSGVGRQIISDGSAALIKDGEIMCATIEERHTRHRYESGFFYSARICVSEGQVTTEQVDRVAFSTCCGTRFTEEEAKEEVVNTLGAEVRKAKVLVVPHHESHAILAFVGSRFERALVAVLDGMGNRLGGSEAKWWKGEFERQSYYLASWIEGLVHLELVDQDAAGFDELGIGEVYRAITHYVGFESYQHAGTVMAMAAFGDASQIKPPVCFIELRHGKLSSPMRNEHDNPVNQVSELLCEEMTAGIPPVPPGSRTLPPQPVLDLVALLQRQVQGALTERMSELCDRLGVDSVCVAGGVALNCLAIGALVKARPDLSVYVPPAPGDTGQGLGNALWATCGRKAGSADAASKLKNRGIQDAGLGPTYQRSRWHQAVQDAKSRLGGLQIKGPYSLHDQAEVIAEQLDQGKIVALRYGRSEYGPRALGYSSVLADPRKIESCRLVNRFKNREWYRPFAPSILSERQTDYFENSAPSPFMSIAGQIRASKSETIRAVVHRDGSARYQTVGPNGPPLMRAVLEQFARRTGVPLLLNTSFNRAGVPMVETPYQAADAFKYSSLDILSIGPYVAAKTS